MGRPPAEVGERESHARRQERQWEVVVSSKRKGQGYEGRDQGKDMNLKRKRKPGRERLQRGR